MFCNSLQTHLSLVSQNKSSLKSFFRLYNQRLFRSLHICFGNNGGIVVFRNLLPVFSHGDTVASHRLTHSILEIKRHSSTSLRIQTHTAHLKFAGSSSNLNTQDSFKWDIMSSYCPSLKLKYNVINSQNGTKIIKFQCNLVQKSGLLCNFRLPNLNRANMPQSQIYWQNYLQNSHQNVQERL